MKKHVYRLITTIAACSMLVAVLTYSRAMAEDDAAAHEESNMCMLETGDTGAFEEAPVSSLASAGADDAAGLRCTYASCRTSADCPDEHPAAPFFCNPQNNCCAPL